MGYFCIIIIAQLQNPVFFLGGGICGINGGAHSGVQWRLGLGHCLDNSQMVSTGWKGGGGLSAPL